MEQELPKPEPLISNKMLGENMDVYEASLEENTSHDVTMRLNMTTAYGAGARNVRDIYEPELQRLRAQVDAMRVAGSALRKESWEFWDQLAKNGSGWFPNTVETQVLMTAICNWDASLNPTPTNEPK